MQPKGEGGKRERDWAILGRKNEHKTEGCKKKKKKKKEKGDRKTRVILPVSWGGQNLTNGKGRGRFKKKET